MGLKDGWTLDGEGEERGAPGQEQRRGDEKARGRLGQRDRKEEGTRTDIY